MRIKVVEILDRIALAAATQDADELRDLKLRNQIRRLPGRSHSDGNGCQCLFSGEWHGNWRNRFQMDCTAVYFTVSTAKNEKNSANYYRIPRIIGVFCQTLVNHWKDRSRARERVNFPVN